jgi:hypothetical protein
VVAFSYCSAGETSARKRLYPPYIKAETLSELRVPCQEILTKKNLVSQETLTKNLCCELVWSRNLDKNAFIAKKPSIKQGLPVEKKTLITAITVSVLLFSALAGTQLVDLGRANPYIWDLAEVGEMPAPEGTEPLTILIISPENNTLYSSNNISINFNTSWSESVHFSWFQIYYEASWQQDKTYVDYGSNARSVTINLTDVPEGSHYLEVVAVAKYYGYTSYQEIKGLYLTRYYVSYVLNGSSRVNFSVDLPPTISILSLENETYNTSNVKLDFSVNESISAVSYSLDGKDNVTISGNTTLTGLPNGNHDVTIYATDKGGNVGSETISFSVDVPFPTTLVISSVITVAVVSIGLLFYFKKHKRLFS